MKSFPSDYLLINWLRNIRQSSAKIQYQPKLWNRVIRIKGFKKEIEMNIYVGNLASETSEDTLNQAFAAFGQVKSVSLIRDGATGE
jgi:RNA recognition motif-containing protein